MAELQEQAAKNNGLALQAKSKGKDKVIQSSKNEDSSNDEDDELDDEQMAFFIKNFRRVLRKGNFRNFGKNKKYESRIRSNRPCFGCNKVGHFIADCPEEKKKNKDNNESTSKKDKSRYKKKGSESRLGQEWDSNEESESEKEDIATMAFKASSPHPTSLFEDLTDDEDQDPIMCFVAKNLKVTSPNSSDDELDDEHEVANLIKKNMAKELQLK